MCSGEACYPAMWSIHSLDPHTAVACVPFSAWFSFHGGTWRLQGRRLHWASLVQPATPSELAPNGRAYFATSVVPQPHPVAATDGADLPGGWGLLPAAAAWVPRHLTFDQCTVYHLVLPDSAFLPMCCNTVFTLTIAALSSISRVYSCHGQQGHGQQGHGRSTLLEWTNVLQWSG